MARNDQYATEIARLHQTAAESRLRVVESELALAFTLCAVAETQIRYSRLDEAIKLLNKIRHHAETISFHVSEPDHLPTVAISTLQRQLTQLRKRTEEIESRLRQR
jgi:vacuolar-type H+-ATPase subunit I/STV1